MSQKTITPDIDHFRPLLETYAYNILGSYEDAQDVVQDVFLKQLHTPPEHVEDLKNYLIKSVVNRAINQKKRQLKIRKEYPGTWLPEPVSTERSDRHIQLSEMLNYSLLVLLERLKPKERAVFILKEAFHYAHEEIAEVLAITLENSRKLLSRAKKALQGQAAENSTTASDPSELLQDYFSAIQQGDVEKLETLFKEEITTTSDGGGKAVANRKVLVGREVVVKFLLGLARKNYSAYDLQLTSLNHQPAVLYFTEGKLVTCQIFEIHRHQIRNIYFVRNPDKLNFLKKKP